MENNRNGDWQFGWFDFTWFYCFKGKIYSIPISKDEINEYITTQKVF